MAKKDLDEIRKDVYTAHELVRRAKDRAKEAGDKKGADRLEKNRKDLADTYNDFNDDK